MFHPLYRHLDISQVITAESSPLRNGPNHLRSKSTDWFPYDNGLRHERVNKLIYQTTDQLLMEYIIVILKNIFQIINLEGELQAFFSSMYLPILILLFVFRSILIFKIHKTWNTNWHCMYKVFTERTFINLSNWCKWIWSYLKIELCRC